MNIFPLGGVQGVQHPSVPNVQYGVLRPLHAPSGKNHTKSLKVETQNAKRILNLIIKCTKFGLLILRKIIKTI